jgi:AT-rich DNA-binding protein
MDKILTKNQMNRMPSYLASIKKFKGQGLLYIKTSLVATDLNLNEEQVKKDLAAIASNSGVPNKGREINSLIRDLETILGYDDIHNAILIGVGNLGRSLLQYEGFKNYGLKIVGAFDNDPNKIGEKINNIRVFDIKLLSSSFNDYNAKIAIIAINDNGVEAIANSLEKLGILAIWNFTNCNITLSNKDIIVSNMNMAANLAVISHQLYLEREKRK